MKVTDLRRKLIAALVAGGLIAPGVVDAANLNQNLVVNGDFELVDPNTVPPPTPDPNDVDPNNPLILNWEGQGFSYSHNNTGGVADYANGGPLAGGGNYYFTPNAPPTDIDAPGQFFQLIDVSGGASGTLIASGNARYSLNAFFSSYANDGDFGNVQAEFLSAADVALGSASIAPFNTQTWTPDGAGGTIPVGTAKVRVSAFGTALSGGPDGYIDNVDFRIGNEIILNALDITINRDDGTIALANRTGAPVNLASYSITSDFEAMTPANWRSIADNYDAGSPGASQVDAAHNWSELTDANKNSDLSEADLESGVGAQVPHNRTINLSNGAAWIKNPNEDLIFQYVSGGVVQQGIVTFTGNGGLSFDEGDLNADGSITPADWIILRSNQHADLTANSLAEAYRLGDLTGDRLNNHADFVAFKTAYDLANGAGSFVAMVASVPEPTSVFLVLVGAVAALPVRRRPADRE